MYKITQEDIELCIPKAVEVLARFDKKNVSYQLLCQVLKDTVEDFHNRYIIDCGSRDSGYFNIYIIVTRVKAVASSVYANIHIFFKLKKEFIDDAYSYITETQFSKVADALNSYLEQYGMIGRLNSIRFKDVLLGGNCDYMFANLDVQTISHIPSKVITDDLSYNHCFENSHLRELLSPIESAVDLDLRQDFDFSNSVDAVKNLRIDYTNTRVLVHLFGHRDYCKDISVKTLDASVYYETCMHIIDFGLEMQGLQFATFFKRMPLTLKFNDIPEYCHKHIIKYVVDDYFFDIKDTVISDFNKDKSQKDKRDVLVKILLYRWNRVEEIEVKQEEDFKKETLAYRFFKSNEKKDSLSNCIDVSELFEKLRGYRLHNVSLNDLKDYLFNTETPTFFILDKVPITIQDYTYNVEFYVFIDRTLDFCTTVASIYS